MTDMPLFRDNFLLAQPHDQPDAPAIAPARPEEIDPSRLLLLDEGHCLADQALAACNQRRDNVAPLLGATSLATVSRLVASGQGLTLIPEIAAPVEGRGLRLDRFSDPEPGRTIGLVTRRGTDQDTWPKTIGDLMLIAGQRATKANVGAGAVLPQ